MTLTPISPPLTLAAPVSSGLFGRRREEPDPPFYKRYELEARPFTKGAYGVVYRAKERGSDEKRFVIKRIPHVISGHPSYPGSGPLMALRTCRELRLLGHLNHPNIVQIVEAGVPPSPLFNDVCVVMPGWGFDLWGILHEERLNLGRDQIAWITCQLLRALRHSHAAGIVHRDIKPANVLIAQDVTACLCDFGLSRAMESDEVFMTSYVQTRYYRAPELLLQTTREQKRAKYSTAVDMWSLGTILAEMMTRRVLFKGQHAMEQLRIISQAVGSFPEEMLALCGLPEIRNTLQRDGVRHAKPWKEVLGGRGAGGSALDEQGLDLLGKLLALSPSARPTAEEALSHPFLADVLTRAPADVPLVPVFDDSWEKGFQQLPKGGEGDVERRRALLEAVRPLSKDVLPVV